MMQKEVSDHLNRVVHFTFPPKRIISLVPSITDTLYSLQLDNEIVGRTRYCIYPKEAVHNAEIVGGTKRIMLDKIRALKPDLIFAEKEENTKEIVEQLEKEFPVYVAEIQSVHDAFKIMLDVGKLTQRDEQAQKLISKIQQDFRTLPTAQGQRVAYVIWKNPYMVVGGNTYIHSLLEKLGFNNVFANKTSRYPVVTENDFLDANLDYIFLATEPFPFKEEHKEAFSKFVPHTTIEILDGEMFWYGPRMIDAVSYFRQVFQS